MPVAVKTLSATNSQDIVYPTGIVAGDLIVFTQVCYNGMPSLMSGFTNIATNQSTGGVYTEYGRLSYKIAAGNENGTILYGVGTNDYGAYHLLVMNGHRATNPIPDFVTSAGGGSPASMAALTTTAKGKRFFAIGTMGNNGNTNGFYNIPSGSTTLSSKDSLYYHAACVTSWPNEAAGAKASASIDMVSPGGWVSFAFNVAEAATSTNHVYTGAFENLSDLSEQNWESNSVFGEFTAATWARTTTKPNAGSYSLEVTCPNGKTCVNANFPNTLIQGKTYKLSADVWVSTGVPDVYADLFFQSGQTWTKATAKNQWVTTTSIFTATVTGNLFPAIRMDTAATAGTKFWVDNMSLVEVPANVYTKQGGVFVLGSGKKVRQGGVWINVPPTKTKSGGAFN